MRRNKFSRNQKTLLIAYVRMHSLAGAGNYAAMHAISICARIPQNAVNHDWFDYMFTHALAIIPKRMCDYVFGDWLSMHAWLWSFCRGPEQGSAERACVEYIFTRARAIIQTRMFEYVCGSGSVCMHFVCVLVFILSGARSGFC
jgi:hypothetical protein